MANYYVTAEQNEPLDALVWRVLGVGSPVVEEVMKLNPNLAGLMELPAGTQVLIPSSITQPVQNLDIITLWD